MRKKRLGVGLSELSGKIYCGSLSANRTKFLSDRQDVTEDAIAAVALKIFNHHNGVLSIGHASDDQVYKISVEKVEATS